MMPWFDLDQFIREKVTRRERSLLEADFARQEAGLHAQLDGARVLVIGGAGSIGSHYIKALLRFEVAKLVVVDISENGLTELVRELRSEGTYTIPRDFIAYPVNFSDRVFVKLFAAHGPFDIVANFAAHKHVRSEKDVFSIEAMIENNVLRAKSLLDLLATCPPRHFFCVSTDKAANPVNIMGASKKLMEELLLAYAERIPVKTARFANVAFSNGSLPQGWLQRIAKRQPWSCPLGIRRFFVSPIESGELCLMASVMGESGEILFPKLDPERDMIPFEQIAHDLLDALGMEACVCRTEAEARERMDSSLVRECIRSLVGEDQELEKGLQPAVGGGSRKLEEQCSVTSVQCSDNELMHSRTNELLRWPVYFFESDTSGEKPYEEFHTAGEVLDMEKFVNLGVVKNAKRRPLSEIEAIFASLQKLFASADVTKAEVVHALKDYLPNFQHIETGKGLDQKM